MCSLVTKYRPQTLSDIHGQSRIVEQLTAFSEQPHSCAFIFHGATGTGKTSTAFALARALGVAVEHEELGGFHQIASGEQTGETVRRTMDGLRFRTMYGSGWKVLVVNEADVMTPNASHVWLDALESLPARTIVIFTTNAIGKLPRRLQDRCEAMEFMSAAMMLRPDMDTFAREVWQKETGRDDCPDLDTLGKLADENGDASFRRLLQSLEAPIRSAKTSQPAKQSPATPNTIDEPKCEKSKTNAKKRTAKPVAEWKPLPVELQPRRRTCKS